MTSSELAFLGLGLILGAATVAALIAIARSPAQRREIRVTVTRDALPRRSETLSQDAFVTSRAEPAPGGPADRRSYQRDPIRTDHIEIQPERDDAWRVPVAKPIHVPDRPANPPRDRTIVPSLAGAVGIAIAPEGERELDRLRVASEDTPTVAAPDSAADSAPVPALERMLRGDHRAMVEVVDRIAGEDPWRRREWELLVSGLVEAMAEVAVQESVIDFPMGTAFWDALTVEQCRRSVTALASMGYEYDGRSGWVANRVPAYRELTIALADIGVDPKRLRAWPNQTEIAALFVGARPAPEELLPAAGPDYAAEDMRAIIGERGPELANLWLAWDAVRPLLFEESLPVDPVEA